MFFLHLDWQEVTGEFKLSLRETMRSLSHKADKNESQSIQEEIIFRG